MLWPADRCGVLNEVGAEARKESFQLSPGWVREDLSQRWRGAVLIIMRPRCWGVSEVVVVTFDDRHLLEGVGQHAGSQHARHSATEHHRLPVAV